MSWWHHTQKQLLPWYWRLNVLALCALCIVFSWQIAKLYARRLEINQQMTQLQQQIGLAEQRNQELQDLIGYLQTPEALDRLAHEKLNVRLPDEQVVMVTPNRLEQTPVNDSTSSSQSNPQRWYHYFFKSSTP